MNNRFNAFSSILLGAMFLIVFSSVGCGGGGGGGADGRTRDTAVRIVHAGIDATPVTLNALNAEGQLAQVQTARYVEETSYVRLRDQSQVLEIFRANAPEAIVRRIPADLQKNTEYTLFIYGEVETESLDVALLTDIVSEPPSGMTKVRLLSAVNDQPHVSLSAAGFSIAKVPYGRASDFQDVPSGPPQQVIAKNSSGRTIASATIDFLEGSELTILVAGSSYLDSYFIRVYRDLD